MSIRDFLWDLFPGFYKEFDTYKDSEGKGLLERYIKAIGTEVDEGVLNYLEEESDDYFLNNIEALKVREDLIVHLADVLGNPPGVFYNEDYRKLLQYIVPIYKIKGTLLAYTLFLNLFGYNVEIIEFDPNENETGLDIPNSYDDGLFKDDEVLYDSLMSENADACRWCSDYSLIITAIAGGGVSMDIINRIYKVVYFIEPINARLQAVVLDVPDFEENFKLCIKQDIMVKLLTSHIYDSGYEYDMSYVYDDDAIESTKVFAFGCEGIESPEGIGYWAIEDDNIVQ